MVMTHENPLIMHMLCSCILPIIVFEPVHIKKLNCPHNKPLHVIMLVEFAPLLYKVFSQLVYSFWGRNLAAFTETHFPVLVKVILAVVKSNFKESPEKNSEA